MQKKLNSEQVRAVLALPGPERYEHFVKRVADWQLAWGLWDNGWASGRNDDGADTFPLWPARDYAALCATGPWEGFQPREIPVETLLDEILPNLAAEGSEPSVFPTPDEESVFPGVELLIEDLRHELSRYE